MTSNERFEKVLELIKETHRKKQADYGTDEDPFANVNATSEFGIDPLVGIMLRMNDKMTRLKSFVKKGKLVNESVEDSLLDLAVYAIIALTILESTAYGYKYGIIPDSSSDNQGTNYQDKPRVRASENPPQVSTKG